MLEGWPNILLYVPMHLEQGWETRLDLPVEYCFCDFFHPENLYCCSDNDLSYKSYKNSIIPMWSAASMPTLAICSAKILKLILDLVYDSSVLRNSCGGLFIKSADLAQLWQGAICHVPKRGSVERDVCNISDTPRCLHEHMILTEFILPLQHWRPS